MSQKTKYYIVFGLALIILAQSIGTLFLDSTVGIKLSDDNTVATVSKGEKLVVGITKYTLRLTPTDKNTVVVEGYFLGWYGIKEYQLREAPISIDLLAVEALPNNSGIKVTKPNNIFVIFR